MLLLVTYDISDDRLRRRVAKVLAGYGRRVQLSAFECRLRTTEQRALRQRLQALLADAGEGASVRLYPLGDRAAELVRELGTGPSIEVDVPVLFA